MFSGTKAGVVKFLSKGPIFRARSFTCAPDRVSKDGCSQAKCASNRETNWYWTDTFDVVF